MDIGILVRRLLILAQLGDHGILDSGGTNGNTRRRWILTILSRFFQSFFFKAYLSH